MNTSHYSNGGYTAEERAFLAEAVAEISSTDLKAKAALAGCFFGRFGKHNNPGTLYSAGLRFRKQMFAERRRQMREAMRANMPPPTLRTMPQIRTRAASGHAAYI